MERPVESARVACPNAAYGCAARPAYYEQQAHRQLCLHTPCRCPGDTCSFIGPTEALLDHFAGVHGWPCSTKVRTGEMSSVRLKNGGSTSSASIAIRAAPPPGSTSGACSCWMWCASC
ncbi:hypothetical protein PAHAL_3G124900 [Panicum hallii]|uniref:SIAH-type domain-containing protein n=1 Tax=Panicum hallii TaxID=206008 RepID=A0A2T8KHZ3_9POAL|nr:E3 ubiquitin-protein ligase SINA-like 4 [Panicum hallii]PVH61796.1 hypothetical protein PAHAL_3G124900 [Panicum hallii]